MRSASRSSGVQSGPTTEAISRVLRADPVADQHRIILAQHLAEVAGRRQVMVQPAIGDEEHVAARHLAVDDATYVNTGLADEIAAQLDDQLRLRQRASQRTARACAGRRRCGSRSSGFSPGKYGMPKPPPRFSRRTGAGAARASSHASCADFACASTDRFGAQILRAAENVEAPELERRADERLQYGRHAFGVDAELLGAAAHLHAGRLELEIGIDADRDACGRLPDPVRDRGQALRARARIRR